MSYSVPFRFVCCCTLALGLAGWPAMLQAQRVARSAWHEGARTGTAESVPSHGLFPDPRLLPRPALVLQDPERTLDQRRRRFEKWVMLGGGIAAVLLVAPLPESERPLLPALRYPAAFLVGVVLGAGVGHVFAPIFVRE